MARTKPIYTVLQSVISLLRSKLSKQATPAWNMRVIIRCSSIHLLSFSPAETNSRSNNYATNLKQQVSQQHTSKSLTKNGA